MASNETNIIQIIQEMIAEGQPENQILQNLKELGIPTEKAKKLILVSQSDVYPIIQSEINRLVEKKLSEKKPEIIHSIQHEIELAEENTTEKIKDKTIQELKEYEKYLENKVLIMESQVNESVQKAVKANQKLDEKLQQDEGRIRNLEVEEKETPIVSHSNAHLLLAGLGILFGLATLYLFWSATQGAATMETLIMGVVLGLITVTIFIVSALV